MFWDGFPYCYFGFGYCDPELPPPPEPEPEEVWPKWPLALCMKMGSWEGCLRYDIIFIAFLSSFVATLTTFFLVLNYLEKLRDSKPDSTSIASPQNLVNLGERPGPLGDHDAGPPPPVPEPVNSILHAACSFDSWPFGFRRKRQNHPTQRNRLSSSASANENRIPQTIRIPSKTMTQLADVQTQSSELQVLFEKEKAEPQFDIWNPLVNYFMQFGCGPVDEELRNIPSNDGQQKLVLHQLPRGKIHPCSVPHAMKLETILRMCGIPHDVVFDCDSTGPWVTFGGETIVGPQNCIRFIQQYFSSHLKNYLTPVEKKVPALYIGVLLDVHLYCGVAIWRCMIEEGIEVVKGQGQPISSSALDEDQKVKKFLKITGSDRSLGRVSGNEVVNSIRDGLIALTASLGSKKHFIGESLTELDCSAFAILSQLLWSSPGHPMEQMIRGYPSLVNYCLHLRQRLWSDWDKIVGVGVAPSVGLTVKDSSVINITGKSQSSPSQGTLKNSGARSLQRQKQSSKSSSRTYTARRVHGQGLYDRPAPRPDYPHLELPTLNLKELANDLFAIPTPREWPLSS